MRLVSFFAVVILAMSVTQADAKRQRHSEDANGNQAYSSGIVKSKKTGATARVSAALAAKFQAYIDDLEDNHGAVIYSMGGIRRGSCSSRHMHPCGKAMDICQLRRGIVSAKCRLPDRNTIAQIASRHGLFEGGQWCHHDYGHVQAGVTAGPCGSNTMAAKRKRDRYAASHGS